MPECACNRVNGWKRTCEDVFIQGLCTCSKRFSGQVQSAMLFIIRIWCATPKEVRRELQGYSRTAEDHTHSQTRRTAASDNRIAARSFRACPSCLQDRSYLRSSARLKCGWENWSSLESGLILWISNGCSDSRFAQKVRREMDDPFENAFEEHNRQRPFSRRSREQRYPSQERSLVPPVPIHLLTSGVIIYMLISDTLFSPSEA